MGAKYVVFRDDSGVERVVVFDKNLHHKDVADRIGWPAVSAGTAFVAGGRVVCMGGSITLGIFDSRERDSELVRRMLMGRFSEAEDRDDEDVDCGRDGGDAGGVGVFDGVRAVGATACAASGN